MLYVMGGASVYGVDVAVIDPGPMAVVVKGAFARPLVDGVVVLAGDSVAAFAAAACDFLRWAAGLER